MEEEALEFARRAHKDQKRKYSQEPYIEHPKRVAEMVRTVKHSTEMICAAYLHDVVEDTPVSLNEIEQRFGTRVAQLVNDLSDKFTKKDFPDLNRRKRKEKEVERQSMIDPDAKTIKLADVIDNTPDILRNDRNFARKYIPEMDALVNVLKDGDPELFRRALKEVQKAKEVLRNKTQKNY
ncbi:MAG TPA: HD domain-containing protein [Salinimicrobium sp.]|nr:HD domain-containing protein [Salinimicrobium sp.]